MNNLINLINYLINMKNVKIEVEVYQWNKWIIIIIIIWNKIINIFLMISIKYKIIIIIIVVKILQILSIDKNYYRISNNLIIKI